MRHPTIKIPAACMVALVVGACDQSGYRGYGEFTDKGPGTADGRYSVDFGPIDLSKPNHKAFRMVGLPSVEFTMGLRPVNVSSGCDAAALNAVSIRLEVKTDNDAIVIYQAGPLNTWVTSSSLVYRRGAERQEAKPGGAFELVRTGVLAADGWGTYFKPQTSATYFVKFDVLEAKGASSCESRLVLVGGGWK